MVTVTASTPEEARKARERIDVRLRPDQKTCIEKAAGIKGGSVSEFIVQNALETAVQTIREHETWALERPDTELFFEALLNPPAPGARLMRAAAQYKKRYIHSE